jgi:histidinol-phosphate aminotransferase
LKRALADKYGASCENVILGHGATEVLEIIARAFVRPGDEIISAHPSFPWFQMLGQMNGGRNVVVPLREHVHDLEAIAASITPETKMIFIANPNNPTGTIVSQREIESFLRMVPDHVIVVLDEAYIEYVTRQMNAPAYTGQKPRIIVRTFSKISGLAGLRIGYGIAERWIIELLEKVRQPFNTTSIAQAAALASLGDQNHLKLSRQLVRDGKNYLYSQFEKLGLVYVPSEANFIFVDFRTDADAVFNALLGRGFIIRPMLKTCARITIGSAEQNVGLVSALAEVLSGRLTEVRAAGLA